MYLVQINSEEPSSSDTLIGHRNAISREVSDLQIPQELVDFIIDELSDDRSALNACSLTSRAWVYRSQYRLHRHLHFSSLKQLTSNPLRYSDPAIAQYVHSLDLATLPTATSPFQCGERIQAWAVLSRFTQVRRLTIRSLEDAATVTPFISMAFANVTELTLGKAEFDSFAQFKSFFASFAHLARFKLERFDVFPWLSESEDEDISEDEDDYLNFPLLRHLTLSGRNLYSEELIDLAIWLRSELPSAYSLQSLTFETWYGGRFGTMKAYLSACRRSLQTLELPMGASEPSIARMNFKKFGFRRLSILKTVTFVCAENPWAIKLYTSDCVPLTIAEITTKTIYQVNLDFSPARGTSMSNLLNFSAVDHALSQSQFSDLRFVHIICNRNQADSRTTAEDIIRQGLTRTVQRGVVRLDFGDFVSTVRPQNEPRLGYSAPVSCLPGV